MVVKSTAALLLQRVVKGKIGNAVNFQQRKYQRKRQAAYYRRRNAEPLQGGAVAFIHMPM